MSTRTTRTLSSASISSPRNVTINEVQPAVQALIDHLLYKGVDIIVLSRGVLRMLRVCPETEDLLRERSIDYRIEPTKKAVQTFNRLMREGRSVGGIFHSTC